MADIININDRLPGPTVKEENVPLDTRSWAPEVLVDNEKTWARNALRFATEDEAFRNARDLMYRWTLVREYRAAPSSDPVNYTYDELGQLEEIK